MADSSYETADDVYAAIEAGEIDEDEAVEILDQLEQDDEGPVEAAPIVLDDEVDGTPVGRDAAPGDAVRHVESGATGTVQHRTDGGVALAGDDRPRTIWPHGTYEVLEVG